MRLRPALSALLAVLAAASVHAQTVVPGAIVFSTDTGPVPLANCFGHIYQDAAQTDYTSAWFNFDTINGTFALVTTVLDEGSDWYLVSAGQTFGWAGIAAGDFTALVAGQPVDLLNDTFYLGATTGRGFDPEPDRSVLGWALLHVVALTPEPRLVIDSSAVAYQAASITVGTLNATPIPEPASISTLAGLFAVALGATRRRRFRPL